MIKVSTSILSADFTKLGKDIKAIEKAGSDMIHIDVMDGHFVPNLSFGHTIIKQIRSLTNLPFDVHLMITNPEDKIQSYAESGADIITVHYENCVYPVIVNEKREGRKSKKNINLDIIVDNVKSLGKKVGISLLPSTNPQVLDNIIHKLDLILVMSVNPGFGGQKFMENQLDKIKYLASKIRDINKDIILSIDGGINPNTAAKCINAGANMLVSGSYIFNNTSYKDAILALKQA